ncbi:DNA adenine methylase [Klebsiella pneumoniae]
MTSKTWQRPFLKWAGGKYTQLADLFVHIPAGKRLIEPFVGGGSVFLNSDKHADYLLADVNPDLINLYQMLVISNSSAPKVLDLYREHGFNLQFINARRSISCKSSTREVAKDVVAIL